LVPTILFPYPSSSSSSTLLPNFRALAPMDDNTINSFASLSISSRSGGRGRGFDVKDNQGGRGRGRGGSGTDKIDALGRLMTRILRHMASELNLNM
ncbi:hypothetical protein, partial [Klebsiella pneumoniae]|uniref:hypothetical protein n=1 Tax=Klebsiella pneumoniae TaxID=573 RepID=UPI003013F8BA